MENKIENRKIERIAKRHGVEITDPHFLGMWLRCKTCWHTWSPVIKRGGKLPNKWWQCPEGCNEKANSK
jgi:hypothetical protein